MEPSAAGDRAFSVNAPAYYARTPTKRPSSAFSSRSGSVAPEAAERGPETAGSGSGGHPNGNNGNGGANASTGADVAAPAADGNGAPAYGWSVLDCSNNTLRNLSVAMFSYSFLTGLRLNNNQLTAIPPAIGRLKSLTVLDLTGNRLRNLPMELGLCHRLRKLLLFNNQLQSLPWEMGMLYQLEQLGLDGNPMVEPLNSLKDEGATSVIHYLRDNAPYSPAPIERGWVTLSEGNPDRNAHFTVYCLNVLTQKFATSDLYQYCPSWALTWEYRKDLILQDILQQNADIVCLQEVETAQFFDFFQAELGRQAGYQGIYRPKSRAKTMSEDDARTVDGCAIFYRPTKFALVHEHVIEFSNLVTARLEFRQSADIFNRVMPKDNIALVALLRHVPTGEEIVVANPHMTWDPAFVDVKLVQTALLMDELGRRYRRTLSSAAANGSSGAGNLAGGGSPSPPIVICGDFNSLPGSAVYQFVAHGHLAKGHVDLAGRSYGPYTDEDLHHRFRLASAYLPLGELPFTNRTPGFTGTIDFVWYTVDRLSVCGVLGPVPQEYSDRIVGMPNAHFPSDHVSLCVELAFLAKPGAGAAAPGKGTDDRSTTSSMPWAQAFSSLGATSSGASQ